MLVDGAMHLEVRRVKGYVLVGSLYPYIRVLVTEAYQKVNRTLTIFNLCSSARLGLPLLIILHRPLEDSASSFIPFKTVSVVGLCAFYVFLIKRCESE